MWWKIVTLILNMLGCVFSVYCAFTEPVSWKVVMNVVIAVAFAWYSYDIIEDLTKKGK